MGFRRFAFGLGVLRRLRGGAAGATPSQQERPPPAAEAPGRRTVSTTRYDSGMESRTTSSAPLTTALRAASMGLLGLFMLPACGGGGDDPSATTASGTPRLENWDPETKQLIKSRGTDLYGQFIGEREWFHRNQTLAKKGQYDNQGREIGEWMEYHQIGSPAARYAYVDGALEGDLGRWPPTCAEAVRCRFEQGKQVGPWTALYASGRSSRSAPS